jgi:ABC-2 type transport system permease protein
MNLSSKNLVRSTKKITTITKILTIEHLREPTSLLWSALAPCILFIITNQKYTTSTYIDSAAWFYSYISATIAFFGFSFYLIGRRESGFTRSFIYQHAAIKIFLTAHTLSYLLLSSLYASLFYLLTKPLQGHYSLSEFLYLMACFYTSYLMFTCIGLEIAALPIKFSTASTLFSLMSFLMLISGYTGATLEHDISHPLTLINPLFLSAQIFHGKTSLLNGFIIALTASATSIYLTSRYFRTQPIWSRY